jgi:hypothetical protein
MNCQGSFGKSTAAGRLGKVHLERPIMNVPGNESTLRQKRNSSAARKNSEKVLANSRRRARIDRHGVFLGNDVKTKKQSRPYFA